MNLQNWAQSVLTLTVPSNLLDKQYTTILPITIPLLIKMHLQHVHMTISNNFINISYLYEIMNSFQTHQIILLNINTHAEVKTSVPTVHNLVVSKLDKVCVFGVTNSNTSMHLQGVKNNLSTVLRGNIIIYSQSVQHTAHYVSNSSNELSLWCQIEKCRIHSQVIALQKTAQNVKQ